MTLIDASTGLKLAKFINSNQLTCVEETVSLEFSQSQVHHFLLNCDSRNEEEVLGFISVYPGGVPHKNRSQASRIKCSLSLQLRVENRSLPKSQDKMTSHITQRDTPIFDRICSFGSAENDDRGHSAAFPESTPLEMLEAVF